MGMLQTGACSPSLILLCCFAFASLSTEISLASAQNTENGDCTGTRAEEVFDDPGVKYNKTRFQEFIALTEVLLGSINENRNNCSQHVKALIYEYIIPQCDANGYLKPPCVSCCSCVQTLCWREWQEMRNIIKESALIFNNDTNPLAFLQEVLPVGCNETALKLYSEDKYAQNDCTDTCLGIPQCDPTSDVDLTETVVTVAAVGGSLVIILLVVIAVIAFCLVCNSRRKKDQRPYFYAKSVGGRTATLLGWPFVHPRQSRLKSKGDLLSLVPEVYRELMMDNAEYLMQPSRIHINTFLAEGSYSEIYQGYLADTQPHSSTYRNVAVKKFKEHVKDTEILQYLELSLKFSGVDHPNVLKVLAVSFDHTGKISIVYPYMEGHDLLSWLKKNRGMFFSESVESFDVTQLVDIVIALADGMKALTEEGEGPYKMLSSHTCMIDLSLRALVGDVCTHLLLSLIGAHQPDQGEMFYRWMAPEAIKEGNFTEKSDVWAFGVTCWEIFTLGSLPYPELEDNEDVLTYITNGNSLKRPDLCPPSLFSLLDKCRHLDPERRPTFAELFGELNMLKSSPGFQNETQLINENIKTGAIPSPSRAIAMSRKKCYLRKQPSSVATGSHPKFGLSPANGVSIPASESNESSPLKVNTPVPATSPEAKVLPSPVSKTDTGGYLKLFHDSDSTDSYDYVTHNSSSDLRERKDSLTSPEDGYMNTDLFPCSTNLTNTQGQVGSLPVTDGASYYNIPAGFLSEVKSFTNLSASDFASLAAAAGVEDKTGEVKTKPLPPRKRRRSLPERTRLRNNQHMELDGKETEPLPQLPQGESSKKPIPLPKPRPGDKRLSSPSGSCTENHIALV